MAESFQPGLYAVDGIDGSGKTSLVTEVTKRLLDEGVDIRTAPTFFREEDADFWRTYREAKGSEHDIICPEIDQLIHSLMFVSVCRGGLAHVINCSGTEEVGVTMVDRYLLSRIALVRWGSGDTSTGLEQFLVQSVTSGSLPTPTLSFFLEVDPLLAYERILEQNHGKVTEEKERLHNLEEAAAHYETLVRDPNVGAALNVHKLDGGKSVDELADEVIVLMETQ